MNHSAKRMLASASLVVVGPLTAFAQDIDVKRSDQTPIPAYSIVEFQVQTDQTFKNPFDPAEVAVDGTFTHADGTKIVLPAYWAGEQFKFRFCPTKPGEWALATTLKTADETEKSTPVEFVVQPSSSKGFVRPSPYNNRYLQLDSGDSFFMVGLNLCWPEQDGMASYDRRFQKLTSVGGNFTRIWTTQERRIESEKAGVGRYDLPSSEYYDELFALAQKRNVRCMWTFDDYRVLAREDFFNAHWDTSPYNSENGGPLKEPTDFFTSQECRQLYKNKLRYLVARYSAFTSIAFWELWNEQDHIPKPGLPIDWFHEMTAYLQQIDPYKHIITTSYSWDDKAEVWQTEALGFTQRHMYGQGDTVDFVTEIIKNAEKMDPYQKPHFIGEFGISWKEPDIALDTGKKGTPLHNALWTSLMTGHAGGALTWWWDNYLEPLDLWHVYIGFSKFVQPIDFAHADFQAVKHLNVEGLTTLAMQDQGTGETLFWLVDPASNWKNDAENKSPQTWTNKSISIPTNQAHDQRVQIWDTRTGQLLKTESLKPQNGTLTIPLPDFQRDIAGRVLP